MFRRGQGFRLEEVRYANKYIYIYVPGFLKTGSAKISSHSTTW